MHTQIYVILYIPNVCSVLICLLGDQEESMRQKKFAGQLKLVIKMGQ